MKHVKMIWLIAVSLLLAVGIAFIAGFSGLYSVNYCLSHHVSAGYLEYAVDGNPFCRQAFFLWGEWPPAWLLPGYLVARGFERTGFDHDYATLLSGLFWFVLGTVALGFILTLKRMRQKLLVGGITAGLLFIFVFGATFLTARSIGYPLVAWDRECVHLELSVIHERFASCDVYQYNVSNAGIALQETMSVEKCKYLSEIPGTLAEMESSFSQLYAHSLMTQCLCKSEVAESSIQEYLLGHDVRIIKRVAGPRILDPAVACNELV